MSVGLTSFYSSKYVWLNNSYTKCNKVEYNRPLNICCCLNVVVLVLVDTMLLIARGFFVLQLL